MATDTYEPGQVLLDADGKTWEVQGINEDESERSYILTNSRDPSTRSVRVAEIGQYYAPVNPGE
jgi:hypothetical protein